MDAPLWLFNLTVVFFGLCVGSFLNVCIVRIPRNISIVTPRSYCPGCDHPIAWYDNIPLLSFVFLGGRCRGCKAWIGLRYPFVEALTAFFAVATFWKFPDATQWAIWFFLFIAPLIAITFIDLEHQIIPDVFSLPGIVIGLGVRAVLATPGTMGAEVLDGVIGVLVGGGFLFAVGYVYEKIRKHEGLGGGDVKLAAMFGAFLGWEAVIVILLFSAALGSIVGIVAIVILRKGLKYAIPYGPFLAAGAIFYLFYGHDLLNWYLSFFLQ